MILNISESDLSEKDPFGYSNWLESFLIYKNIDKNKVFKLIINNTSHWIPVINLILILKSLPSSDQSKIKNIMLSIDFNKIDINHYLFFLIKTYCLKDIYNV